MNILFVHEVDWFQKVVFDMHLLAEAMSLRGHKVYAIDYEEPLIYGDCRTLRKRDHGDVSRALKGSSVNVITPGIINIPGLRRISAFLSNYVTIGHILKERIIDAVILYSVATNGWPAIIQAHRHHIPVLFRSIDILHRLAPPLFKRPVKALERFVYSHADMVLTITPALSDYVAKLGGDRRKIKLLPVPVDTAMFHPFVHKNSLRQRWGIGDADRVILYMGTLFDFSGVDMLLNIMPEVTSKYPSARLLIVGDGPQRKELDMIIKGMGLGDRVKITGFEPYNMMPQFINMADVCVCPFRINEATRDIFPGKVSQYLACGKPVVATPLPGLKAMIRWLEEGVTYASAPWVMAEKIIHLLEDKEQRQYMGIGGLGYAQRFLSIDSIAEKLEIVVNEVYKSR